ncbi:hypothetical protein ACP70R_030653 [Stipagrostis hirtigluma subsp. patula]
MNQSVETLMLALNSLANHLAASSATSSIHDARLQHPWRHSGTFCSPLFIPHERSPQLSSSPPLHSPLHSTAAAAMEARKTGRALLASFVLAALAAQALVAVVESRSSPAQKASQGDVKKPDCVPGMDPRTFPGIGGGHGGITPLPSHGGSSGTTPSHGGGFGTPSHGGSGSSPSHGGSGLDPSHGGSGTSPSHGGYGTTPAAPSTGGGYGGSPASPSHGGAYGSSPTPSHGGAYGSSPTPSHGGAYGGSTPAYGGSPSTPSHGGIGTSSPTPFVPVNPHSPGSLPGTCDYWRSHPMEIWSAIGGRWPGTTGRFFGTAGSAAAGGADVSIQDALANTRTDGAGALLREGAAALLNSMTRAGFPYTTEQVRDAFAAAAAGGSDGAAAAQAAAFKKANEGRA